MCLYLSLSALHVSDSLFHHQEQRSLKLYIEISIRRYVWLLGGCRKNLILGFLEVRLYLHTPLTQTPMSRNVALEYSIWSTVEEGQVGLKLNGTY
jgi:hypothetical protein